MKIGILSDSHLSDEDIRSKSKMYLHIRDIWHSAFNDVQQIIHAGDIYSSLVIEDLETMAPVHPVEGNGDLAEFPLWPRILHLTFENIKIAVAHNRLDLYPFANSDIKIFIFGHSHRVYHQINEKGQLWFNPGSIRRPMGENIQRSLGILLLQSDTFDVEIKYYD